MLVRLCDSKEYKDMNLKSIYLDTQSDACPNFCGLSMDFPGQSYLHKKKNGTKCK